MRPKNKLTKDKSSCKWSVFKIIKRKMGRSREKHKNKKVNID